ncbi:GGDEF domain-containing protein [Paenibacillus monticola]|uniref:Diguanylate cyclase n=1 Tax=Paenibacillus monticola TaxID=2666075 RepID=A0A7X2H0S0_9BACL|nr:GGDEF domain-containing protein [Paenibacillus monticola]MRN51410.1 diguanylate cyclase [Paenibacillus monticola]
MLNKLITLPFTLEIEEQRQLQKATFEENIARGKLFAKITIGIEGTLATADIIGSLSKAHASFHFSFYFAMYLFLILLNICVLWGGARYDRRKEHSKHNMRTYETAFFLYAIFFMVWGSVVTLVDQRLYGQLMAFVVNVMSISVIFYFNNRRVLFLYCISTFTLFIGLPFFQHSSEVLIGHYVNLTIFLFFSWVASRILYVTYCSNFYSRILLKQSNQRLEDEIKANLSVHEELELANEELQKISLVDALTEIPNRRAFDQRVQALLSASDSARSVISIIMLDIDFFKLFNDNYGHAEGDDVITKIAQTIHAATRSSLDIAARMGGEEFVFAAFNTNEQEAIQLGESIRCRIQELRLIHEYSTISPYVTVSLGTATGPVSDPEQFAELMKMADEALYSAKANGRNSLFSMNRPKSRPQ